MTPRRTLPTSEEIRQLVRELEDAVVGGVDEAVAWLDSPRGRRYRALAARGLVLAAPMILKHPFFRTPVGKVVALAGGASLVEKVADAIRDWEPSAVRSTSAASSTAR
ncbi:MAG TPA: hypothetical protein VEC15_02250 [Actinomycetota bacterium]|nr:hypothetical protein [Actinomycetota bacterium]